MPTQQLTSKEYFKALNIIFYALIYGQLLFVALALYLVYSGNFPASLEEMETLFMGIMVFVFSVTFWGGKAFFKSKLRVCKQKKSLMEKMTEYRSALIIRYALLELSSFLGIIFFMLSGNKILLVISVLIITLFFTLIPGKEKAIFHLQLNVLQRRIVNNPRCIVAEVKLR